MLRLVKSDLAVTADELDTDLLKLNCLNGTVDLRTGILMPHRENDYITKLVPVRYDPTAKAVRFEQFLRETFCDNDELIEFVRRALGYSLSGSTKEQKLFMCHGEGQNGKTTLFTAVREIAADYAQETDPTLLILKTHVGGPTEDVARLRGVRLATTIETNEGVRLDEARVKQLTGGDRLAACYKYGHIMEFDPTHKLFLISNHKPHVSSQSMAMWRRICMIPFNATVPEHLKDKDLPDKLRAEYEGILAWLVRGCLNWQDEGLPEPPEVENATAQYKAEMDSLKQFIEEFYIRNSESELQSSILRNHYTRWCKETGEQELNRNQFSQRMRDMGFREKQTNRGTMWCGIGVPSMAQGVSA